MRIPKIFSFKRIERKIVIDKRTFNPCQAKETEVWSWKKFRSKKWIIHVDKEGNIKTRKIS